MISQQIKEIFCRTLKVDESVFQEDLAAGDIPEWDSLGHINLLQAIEKEFNIAIDVGDAIDIENVHDLVKIVQRYVNTN